MTRISIPRRLAITTDRGATEGLVKVAQVIRQYKHKPKLLRRREVKIRQNVESQVQLLMHTARIAFELRSERHDLRSECPDV